jgi:predicted nuclease of predicted toxin-antitoxin system
VKILLDENFPLGLVRRLRQEGREVEHIILLRQRGTPDRTILDRLSSEDLLFVTNDQEFLELRLTRSSVIVSQVTQGLPIAVRVEIWLKAIQEYFAGDWEESFPSRPSSKSSTVSGSVATVPTSLCRSRSEPSSKLAARRRVARRSASGETLNTQRSNDEADDRAAAKPRQLRRTHLAIASSASAATSAPLARRAEHHRRVEDWRRSAARRGPPNPRRHASS